MACLGQQCVEALGGGGNGPGVEVQTRVPVWRRTIVSPSVLKPGVSVSGGYATWTVTPLPANCTPKAPQASYEDWYNFVGSQVYNNDTYLA